MTWQVPPTAAAVSGESIAAMRDAGGTSHGPPSPGSVLPASGDAVGMADMHRHGTYHTDSKVFY